MNVWIRRTLQVGLMAGGLVLAGAVAANAEELDTSKNYGAGNGNQVVAPIQLPTNVCGNAIAAVGEADAVCEGGSTAKIKKGSDVDLETSKNYGLGNGNQGVIPVQIPIDVSGNSGTLGGDSDAMSKGGSDARLKRASADPHLDTSKNYGIGNGNQAVAPVQTPVSVCGNAASAAGASDALCEGGSSAKLYDHNVPEMDTEKNYGIGNGNQGYTPGQAPIDVSGNAAAGVGESMAASEGGSKASLKRAPAESNVDASPQGTKMETSKNYGIGNGNQLYAPIQVPVSVCGNAVPVLGQAEASCEGGAKAKLKSGDGPQLETSKNYGIGNGNQVVMPVQVPISVCGNAVAGLGEAEASCKGGSDAIIKSSAYPTMESSKNYGIGVGNQLWIPVQAPIEVSGNSGALLGEADAVATDGSATALLK